MKKIIGAVLIMVLGVVVQVRAQSPSATWPKTFDAYRAVWQRTKLHLIFNQDKYSPGDTAFFKAYFLKEDLTVVAGKQLIDLNIVDSRGNSRLHFMFNVNSGVGNNQLIIPDTLSAGIYLIAAYSSWMKNFDQAIVFRKAVQIVRTNKLEATEVTPVKISVEGGHLIGDVANRISIRTYRPAGPAQIVDAAGQEVQKTMTDVTGVGSIVFTPARNGSYFLQLSGETTKIPLPKTEADGCSLFFKPSTSEGPAKLLASSPAGSSLRNQELIILVNARGKIVYADSFTQGGKEFSDIQLPKEKLPEGISHISILNSAGDVLASRDFYNQGDAPIQADILAIHKYYQTREKVRLEVTVKDEKGLPAVGEFAIGVTTASLFGSLKRNSLSDELNILSGTKENFPVDRSDPNWLTTLDNNLILGTEEIPWKEILFKRIPKPPYTFNSVIQKTGRAFYADTHQPVPPSTQVMLYLQRDRKRYLTLTSDNGKIALAIFDVFGRDELFYFAENKGSEIPNLKIEWEEEQFNLPKAPQSRETENPDLYASFIGKTKLIDRSYGYFSNQAGSEPDKVKLNSNNFEDEIKGGADATVNVQDYILFPTMEELVKEVIPALRTRKYGQKSTVRVTLPEPYIPLGEPLYIIDGIATRNTAFFLSFKPVDVLTVKVIRDHQKLGPLSLLGKSGIVIVQTKKGNAREPLDDQSKIIEGLSSPIQFPEPDYSGAQDTHIPDFRSTVYWNPMIKTDANGKAIVEFFCSDDTGKLNIRVDGMVTGGKAFSTTQELEVGLGPEKK